MSTSYDKSAAVVLLPAVSGGRLKSAALKRWLSRANLEVAEAPRNFLATVLGALGSALPDAGLAALRMWGQTGDRPTVWIAGADPIYLEPRLDRLCLHAIGYNGIPESDLRPLFDHLQTTLAEGDEVGFVRLGSCGYLRAVKPIATADLPSEVIDQQVPDEFLPSGDAAGGYRGLISEVEMSLHDHKVNLRRQEHDLQPINSLWIWGGGIAPELQTVPHPPLYCNDPLVTGYWLSMTGAVATWPGTIAACLEASVAGFVAITPADDDPKLLEQCLLELRDAVRLGRLTRLRLIFRDGFAVDVKSAHQWRFWRRTAGFLE